MKRTLICLTIVFVIIVIVTICGYASREGDTIRIYVTGRDARPLIDDFNSQIGGPRLILKLVESEADADVTVTFLDKLRTGRSVRNGNSVAASYTYRGHIDILNSASNSELLLIL